MGVLFFDPSRGTLYTEHAGILYEWDLQKISIVLNGGLGRSRMSTFAKLLFITPFVVH